MIPLCKANLLGFPTSPLPSPVVYRRRCPSGQVRPAARWNRLKRLGPAWAGPWCQRNELHMAVSWNHKNITICERENDDNPLEMVISYGSFHQWRYFCTSIASLFHGKSHLQMDDLGVITSNPHSGNLYMSGKFRDSLQKRHDSRDVAVGSVELTHILCFFEIYIYTHTYIAHLLRKYR